MAQITKLDPEDITLSRWFTSMNKVKMWLKINRDKNLLQEIVDEFSLDESTQMIDLKLVDVDKKIAKLNKKVKKLNKRYQEKVSEPTKALISARTGISDTEFQEALQKIAIEAESIEREIVAIKKKLMTLHAWKRELLRRELNMETSADI